MSLGGDVMVAANTAKPLWSLMPASSGSSHAGLGGFPEPDGEPTVAQRWQAVLAFARGATAEFTPNSVLAVLHAGCSSPSAIHRLPSLAMLWAACLAEPPSGTRHAEPADMEAWVEQLRALVPELEEVEDWVPSDLRLSVHTAFRGRFWPLHPGLLGWPTQLVESVRRWAQALDPHAVERLGFGLGDLLDITLRITAAERLRVSGCWGEQRPQTPTEPAVVEHGEVFAIADLLGGWNETVLGGKLPEVLLDFRLAAQEEELEPEYSARLARALEFATTAPRDLTFGAGFAAHTVNALAVDSGDHLIPVPAGVALEGLAAVVPLAVRALSDSYQGADAEASVSVIEEDLVVAGEQVFLDTTENLLAHRVPVHVEAAPGRYWLLAPSARHVVGFAVAAGLDAGRVDAAIERVSTGLESIAAFSPMVNVGSLSRTPPQLASEQLPFDARLLAPGGDGCLAPDTSVALVILVDGPRAPRYEWNAGAVELSIDDWRYIVGTAHDPEEVWAFLDELYLLPGAESVQAFDVIDLWTAFRRDGGLGAGLGDAIVAMYPPQAALDAHWVRAASWNSAEVLLRSWGLGGVEAWPSGVLDDYGQAELWSLERSARMFVDCAAAFGVVFSDEDKTVDARFAHQLAEEIYKTLHRMAGSAGGPDGVASARGWSVWYEVSGGQPVLVRLAGVPSGAPDPAQLLSVRLPDTVMIVFDEQQLKSLNVTQMHDWLGRALGDGVLALAAASRAVEESDEQQVLDSREIARAYPDADLARTTFVEGWDAVPASLRSLYYSGPSARATTVFSASTLGGGARSRAGRRIGFQVTQQGIVPQEQRGPDAIALLSHLCEAAEAALREQLAGFDGAKAVPAAADEIERFWELRSYNEQMRAVGLDADPLRRAALQVDEAHTGRAGDLLFEELLRHPPSGAARMDHRDWTELIHLAAECLNLRGNLDAARCGLLDLTLHVVPGGAIRIEHSSELMDLPSHQAERGRVSDLAIGDLIEDVEVPQTLRGDNPFASLRLELERQAMMAPTQEERHEARLLSVVDDTMVQHMGAGLDAVLAVLQTAAAWPVPGDPFGLSVSVPADELIADVAAWSGLDVSQIVAAVDQLTLTSARLLAEEHRMWTVEGRDARLVIRPLVAASDGVLRVLPRRAAATRRVYANYLSDGRLPRPGYSLPEPVSKAVEAWRQRRNRRFEQVVDGRFAELGVALRRRSLKPNKARAVGLELTREIDLLALEQARRIIWVVEAKDQHVPFEPASLVKEVVDFHGAEPDASVRAVAPRAKSPQEAFLGKLLDNVRQVDRQKAAVLAAFNIDPIDAKEWQVRPIVVTPRPCAAGAVPGTKIPFATPATLAVYVGATARA